MRMIEPLLAEFDQETVTTRRFLERVPEDKLSWRPHPKSYTLGQLALHVAESPGQVAQLTEVDTIPAPDFGNVNQPKSRAEVVSALEQSLTTAHRILGGMTDERAMQTWRVMKNGTAVMSLPRIGLVRAIMLNHWYHHRAQLGVYLRLLDVPVPAAYGDSADEHPMA